MKRITRFLSPLFTAFLCLSLAFPPQSVYALRVQAPNQGLQRAGLVRHLAGLEESSPILLAGPQGEITGLALGPGARFAVAGSTRIASPNDREIKLFRWDLSSGNLNSSGEESGQIVRACFSPDGRLMVTGFPGGLLTARATGSPEVLWKRDSARSKDLIKEVKLLHLGFLNGPKGPEIVSATRDGQIGFWDPLTGEPASHFWQFHESSVAEMDLHPKGRLAILDKEGTVKVWKLSGTGFKFYKSPAGKFTHVRFLKDENHLLLVSAENVIEAVEISTGTVVRRFQQVKGSIEPAAPIQKLVLSQDGSAAATADPSGRIIVWDTLSDQPVAVLKNHSSPVSAMAFDSEGNRLLSGDQSGKIYLWSLAAPEAAPSAGLAQPDQGAGEPSAPEPVSTLERVEGYVLQQPDGPRSPYLKTKQGAGFQFKVERLKGILLQGRGSDPQAIQAAEQVLQQFQRWGGEILVVPWEVLGSSVLFNRNERTLCFALKTLQQADLGMIEQAMSNENFSALRAWASDAPEASEPEPKPAPQPKKDARAAPDSEPAPPPARDIGQEILSGYQEEQRTLDGLEWQAPADGSAERPKEKKRPEPQPVVDAALQQQLSKAWNSAQEGTLQPNTVVLGADPKQPIGMRVLAFDESDSPHTFTNFPLFPEGEFSLVLPNPRRWPGRHKLQGHRFAVRLPTTFEAGRELADEAMTAEWNTASRDLEKKLDDKKDRLRAPPDAQRQYLMELADLADRILSLPDSKGQDARRRLVEQLETPAKAEELVDVFEQMEHKVFLYGEKHHSVEQQLARWAEEERETVDPSQIRPALEELVGLIPDGSPMLRPAGEYLERLGTDPVQVRSLLIFLDQIRRRISNEAIPRLFRIVPADRLDAVYHDAVRLVRRRQLAQLRSLLDSPLGDLKEQVPLVAYQVFILEWDNAFYRYVLQEARPVSAHEKVADYQRDGVGILFLRPDGTVRRFIPGGGSIHAVEPGPKGDCSFYTHHLDRWREPGDRIVLLFRCDSGHPNPMQIREFMNDMDMFSADGIEVLMGAMGQRGSIRIFKPNVPPNDLSQWTEACFHLDLASAPYFDLVEKLEKVLFHKTQRGVLTQSSAVPVQQAAFLREFPGRASAFKKILFEALVPRYLPDDAEAVNKLFRDEIDDVIRVAMKPEHTVPQQVARLLGPVITSMLKLSHGMVFFLAERASSDLIGPGALMEPVEVSGLTESGPLVWTFQSKPVSKDGYGPIAGPMREAAQRALRGEWGPHQLGFAYQGLGEAVLEIFVDIPSSISRRFQFILLPGAPTISLPVPHPSLISDSKAVRESGRYLAPVDLAEIIGEVKRIPGVAPLFPVEDLPLDRLLAQSQGEKRAWLGKTVPALLQVLERRDGQRGTVEERLNRARQRYEPPAVDDALTVVRGIWDQRKTLVNAITEAARRIPSAAQGETIPFSLLDPILAPVVQALAPWPRVHQVLDTALEAYRARRADPGQVDKKTFMKLLGELCAGVDQQSLFLIRDRIPDAVLADLYHDLIRGVFLGRLRELEAPSALQDTSDERLAELHALALQLLELEKMAAIYDRILQQAKPAPAGWTGSGLPLGNLGILFMKGGKPVRFAEGAGNTIRDRSAAGLYLNAPLSELCPPEQQDTVVLMVPSRGTGSPNIAQIKAFLDDWLLLQNQTSSEIWMGTMTESGTLRLFRPNVPKGDTAAWARLKNSMTEEGWYKFESFLYKKIFSPNPNGWAEAERLLGLGQNFVEVLKEGLLQAFGQAEADRIWKLLQPRFQKELSELSASLAAGIPAQLPAVAYRIVMAVGELRAMPFMADPSRFAQKEIPGFATTDPPSLSFMEGKTALVSMTARPIEWKKPADPAPVSGESVDATALQRRMKQVVPDLVEGFPSPDSWKVGFTRSDHSVIWVHGDVSGTPGAQPHLQWVLLPKFPYMPLLPDPRQIDPKMVSYSSRLEVDEAMMLLPPEVSDLQKMIPPGSGLRSFRVQTSLQKLNGRLPEILRWGRQMVERVDPQGRTPGERLQALQQSDPERAASRASAAQAILSLLNQQAELSGRILAAQRKYWRKSQEGGRVPVGEVRALCGEWLPKLAPWPRVQIGLQGYLEQLEEGGTVDPSELADLFEDGLGGMRHETPFTLSHAEDGMALSESYYDASRETWRLRLLELEKQLAAERSTEKIASEILWAGEQVVLLEAEAALTQKMIDNARTPPDFFFSTLPAIGGVGALFISPEGKMRWVLGASGVSQPLTASANFFPDGLRPWHREGETIVLLYPSFTGIPNLNQLHDFCEDRLRLQGELRGSPPVWLGTAMPDGSVRLFRPNKEWLEHMGTINEVLHDRYLPIGNVISREYLNVEDYVKLRDLAKDFPERFQKWLVDSGIYDAAGAAEVFQLIHSRLGAKVGSNLKALVREFQEAAAQEIRKKGPSGASSGKYSEVANRFRIGLGNAAAQSIMILQEQMAKPLIASKLFTEMPLPGAPDPAEELNKLAAEFSDSALKAIQGLGLSRDQVIAMAKEWIAEQGSPKAKLRKVDFINHMRLWKSAKEQAEAERRREQEVAERLAASQMAWIADGYGMAAEESARQWRIEEEARRKEKEELKRQAAQAAQEAQARQKQLAAEAAALQLKNEELRRLAGSHGSAVPDLSVKRRPAVPSLPPVPPAAAVPLRLPSAGAGSAAAQAEIERLESGLSKLFVPATSLAEIQADLTAVNSLNGLMDPALGVRLRNLRVSFGGAFSMRTISSVKDSLAAAASVSPLQDAEQRLLETDQQIETAMELLQALPDLLVPVQQLAPVAESVLAICRRIMVLTESKEPAEIRQALEADPQVSQDDRVPPAWRQRLQAARDKVLTSLLEGDAGGAGDPQRIFVETLAADSENLYRLFIEQVANDAISPELEAQLQALEGRLQKARELTQPPELPEQKPAVDRAGFQIGVMRRYQEGKQLQSRAVYSSAVDLRQHLQRTEAFLKENKQFDDSQATAGVILQKQLFPDLVSTFAGKLLEELGRVRDGVEMPPAAHWKALVEFRPVLDDAVAFLLKSGGYDAENQKVLREHRLYFHKQIEDAARAAAIERQTQPKTHELTLKMGQTIRLIHRYSGRDIDIRFDGKVERAKQGVTLAELQLVLPPGLVGVAGDILSLGQSRRNWRGRDQDKLRTDFRSHQKGMENANRFVRQDVKIRLEHGKYGVSHLAWVFEIQSLEAMMQDSNIVLLEKGTGTTTQNRIQDLYSDLLLQLESIAGDMASIRLTVQDVLDLYSIEVINAGLEEREVEQNRFQARIAGMPPRDVHGALTEWWRERADLLGQILVFYRRRAWRATSSQNRGEIIHWLTDNQDRFPGKRGELFRLFHDAALDDREDPITRLRAAQGMARTLTPRRPAETAALAETARRLWGESRDWLLEPLEVQRARLFTLGMAAGMSAAEWRQSIGIEPGWRFSSEALYREVDRTRAPGDIGKFLSWIFKGEKDPRPELLRYPAERWERLSEPQRKEMVVWLADRVDRKTAEQSFAFFSGLLSRSAEFRLDWWETLRAAARGICEVAPYLSSADGTAHRLESLRNQLPATAPDRRADPIRADLQRALKRLGTDAAGLEEAKITRNSVVFLDRELFDAEGLAQLDDLTLTGLGIDLSQALAGLEETRPEVQVALVSDETRAEVAARYAGWRLIDVRRMSGSTLQPLPPAAVPVVVGRAVELNRPLFLVVVTDYLHLQDWTLPEALSGLTQLLSA